MAISKLVDARVLSLHHGGAIRGGRPKVGVLHSTETPIQNGRAWQSAEYVRSVRLSAQYFVDPGMIVAGLDESRIGWGAGTVNPISTHFEFTGYAEYTRARWLAGDTESGLSMIVRGAELIADWARRHTVPLRPLTDAQLHAAYHRGGPGGLTTHAQCSRVLGGTTHWDPGTGFPLDLLLTGAVMADLSKQRKATDYRGRFTTGTSPVVTKSLEDYLVNTWEFVKYCAGRLDENAAAMTTLTKALARIETEVTK